MDEGIEVLRRLASHPSTADWISTKLVRRFVNDDPPPGLVAVLRGTFLQTDGDLREVVRTLLTHPEFYRRPHRSAKVKTPLELVASALRAAGAEVDDGAGAAKWVDRLGQPILGAMSPAGWPENAAAVTSAGGMLRRFTAADRIARNRIRGVFVDTGRWAELMGDAESPDSLLHALLQRRAGRRTVRAVRMAWEEGASPSTLATIILSSPEFQQQ
jgi:uncharacterized protein (DUF1800 family)